MMSISGSGATSTISFFGATSTGLLAGNGQLASSSKNWISIGDGKTMASMSINNGSLCVDSDGFCGSATTTGQIIASRGFATANIDLAEEFPSRDSLMAGQIVDAVGTSSVEVAQKGTGHTLVGIVSTAPGFLLGLGPDDIGTGRYPIALAGRVPVKVTLDNGPIATGDRITLSSQTPGAGMKAGPYDETVGIALEPYNSMTLGDGIMVFVNLRNNADMLALAQQVASSTATTTTGWLINTAFASSTSYVKDALTSLFGTISNIAQTGVRHLGSAVYATAGVFNSLITQQLTADVVNTQKLCLGTTCIDENQLKTILNAQAAGTGSAAPAPTGTSGGASAPGSSTTPDTTAPTVSVVGANPASVTVGEVYIDLGATVTDNRDPSPTMHTFLDGFLSDSFSLNTSAAGIHHVDYVATDNSGNTATSTRVINIVAVSSTTASSTAISTTP